jgi:catechol 2,3-dioxygenase
MQKNLDPQFYGSMADHTVSESIYIHNLDYNEITFYRDRLLSEWRWNGDKVYIVTEPLDVKDLLIQSPHEM